MTARKKYFQNSSFTQNKNILSLNEEHKKSFGTLINKLGYPDMGNGRYSSQLSYSDWIQFNNYQRCHYNMVESSGPVLATMIVGGFFDPILCSLLGLCYGFGMLIFSFGYSSSKGADGRLVGATIRSASSVLLFLFCLYNALGILSQQILEVLLDSLRVMEDED